MTNRRQRIEFRLPFMRSLIELLNSQFADSHRRSLLILDKTADDKLFWTPFAAADVLNTLSVGGAVLRSAAMVEQAFLGITRRLWDDPFEWTLPEALSTKRAICEYLAEVEQTRIGGLKFLTSDTDLSRFLPAPEKLKSIFAVLVGAIAKAEYHLGRADALSQMSNGPSVTPG